MILQWMLISVMVAAATGLAALAAAGAAPAIGRPSRWSWAAALVFSTLWPAWLLARAVVARPAGGTAGDARLPPVLVTAGRTVMTAAGATGAGGRAASGP